MLYPRFNQYRSVQFCQAQHSTKRLLQFSQNSQSKTLHLSLACVSSPSRSTSFSWHFYFILISQKEQVFFSCSLILFATPLPAVLSRYFRSPTMTAFFAQESASTPVASSTCEVSSMICAPDGIRSCCIFFNKQFAHHVFAFIAIGRLSLLRHPVVLISSSSKKYIAKSRNLC